MDSMSLLSSDTGASIFDYLYERQRCALRRLSTRLRVVVNASLERVHEVHVPVLASDGVHYGLLRACPKATCFTEVGVGKLDNYHRPGKKQSLACMSALLLLFHEIKLSVHLKKLMVMLRWPYNIADVLVKFPRLTHLDIQFCLDTSYTRSEVFAFRALSTHCPLLESFTFASASHLTPTDIEEVRHLADLESLRELHWGQTVPTPLYSDFLSVLPTALRVLNIASANFTSLEHFEIAAQRMPELEEVQFHRYLAQRAEAHRVLNALPNIKHADFPFHTFRSYPGSLPKAKTLSLSQYEKTNYDESAPEHTFAALRKCPAVEELSLRLLRLPPKFPHTKFLRKLDLLRCEIPANFGTTLAYMEKLTDLKFSSCRGELLSEGIVSALRSTSLERLLIFPRARQPAEMLTERHVRNLLAQVALDYLCIDVRSELEAWVKAFPVRMANPRKFLLANVSRVSMGMVYCEESVYVNGKRVGYPSEFKYR